MDDGRSFAYARYCSDFVRAASLFLFVGMPRKRLRAVLFGPQGSGKGTQGRMLADYFGVPLIGSGELFRAEIQEKSALGKLVKSYVGRGALVPDELVNAVVQKQLKAIAVDRGFLLDGYPRNVEQAESLDKVVKINLALQIKIGDDESLRRLLGRRQCTGCKTIFHIEDHPPAVEGVCDACGKTVVKREDDNEDIIRARLEAYHFMTEPLASYYRQRGVLLAVKGEQPIASLYEELVRKVTKLGFVAK